MADNWTLAKGGACCAGCGLEFRERQAYFSALIDQGDDFSRRDFCTTCWAQAGEGGFFSFWRARWSHGWIAAPFLHVYLFLYQHEFQCRQHLFYPAFVLPQCSNHTSLMCTPLHSIFQSLFSCLKKYITYSLAVKQSKSSSLPSSAFSKT